MAIILEEAPKSGESTQFFVNRSRIFEAINRFGNIQSFVAPLCPAVRQYAIEKIAGLFFENARWKGNGSQIDPRKVCWRTAKNLVDSEKFGEPKIEHYSRITFLIKAYLKEKKLSELPGEFKGIGSDFYQNTDKFLQILEELLLLLRGRRLEVLGGIRFKKEFIDRYVGQFIWDFFWFIFHAGKYPGEYFVFSRR